jgi:hypothetical protein
MARRKNASFTGSALSEPGKGSRKLVDEFYREINYKIPGSTPVPIPPPASVHPKYYVMTQFYIFADYTVRKLVPMMLDARGGKNDSTNAAKLRALPKIVNKETARHAHAFAESMDPLSRAVDAAYPASVVQSPDALYVVGTATAAAFAACDAAELNPDATWEVVNEMLAAL